MKPGDKVIIKFNPFHKGAEQIIGTIKDYKGERICGSDIYYVEYLNPQDGKSYVMPLGHHNLQAIRGPTMQDNPTHPGQKPSPSFLFHESPRDRFLKYGQQAISPVEVLAIVLNGGNRWNDTLSLSESLLIHFGGFCGLYAADNSKILKIKGMGQSKLAQIRATMELNRLYLFEEVKQSPFITSLDKVCGLIRCSIREYDKEEVWILLLTRRNKLIEKVRLASGNENRMVIDLREIGRQIFKHRAARLIFAHTHPSGDSTPSEKDKSFTRKLANFCTALTVEFPDHVIIGQNSYYSFNQAGFLPLAT